jgi:uncharacterized protein YbjQ (UPF0145 family)
MVNKIIATTGLEISGHKIKKVLGIVRGNIVQSRNIGRNILAGLKSLAGGEIKTYTGLTNEARDEAFKRMIHEAEKIGADAIISMRFTTTILMGGDFEMLAYGTAVKF